ncbi:hypothetical protein [Sorangium sp. So ce426]|uniref:hypothetical protein n=1 Tax=unclassified Sorangium TaxID=2621164 RepID=UPI003F5BAA13
MRSLKKFLVLTLSLLAAASGAACAKNLLRVTVPARAANSASIHAVDIWIDQTPIRLEDGGPLSTGDDGTAWEGPLSMEIKDHTGSEPTQFLPAGSDFAVNYGAPTVTALFASGASAVLIPPANIPADSPTNNVRRNRYRLRLTLAHAARNAATCEITDPAPPQNWEIVLKSTVPSRFCIVSMAPAGPPCAGTPAVLDGGSLAGLQVMQLENSSGPMPTIQGVNNCQDVLADNPLPP